MAVLLLNAVNILMTIGKRVEPKLYVSLWFIIGDGGAVPDPVLHRQRHVDSADRRAHRHQRHDLQLVLRAQRARVVVHDGPARGHLLHRPAGDIDAAVQPVPRADRASGASSSSTPASARTTCCGRRSRTGSRPSRSPRASAMVIPVLAFMFNILLTMRGNWSHLRSSVPLLYTIDRRRRLHPRLVSRARTRPSAASTSSRTSRSTCRDTPTSR